MGRPAGQWAAHIASILDHVWVLSVSAPNYVPRSDLWRHVQARNNSELLANLGNFVNRVLKFIDSRCVTASTVIAVLCS